MAMDKESQESKPRPGTLVGRIKNLLGVGVYLLLLGLVLEGLTLVVRQWISFPISLTTEAQILFTALCVSVCLLGVVWFNRSLNLIKVHLLEGKNELVTVGPFAYVRHPLYATLVMTIPPLLVVWLADLLFVVPWAAILVIAHLLVRLEERKLMEDFGSDYARYREHVPALFPYKGAGGKRYRGKGQFLGRGARSDSIAALHQGYRYLPRLAVCVQSRKLWPFVDTPSQWLGHWAPALFAEFA